MPEYLLTIHAWMSGSGSLAALGAFLWGLVSVLLSPCHLAAAPLIVGYVAGQGRLVTGFEAARYAVVFTGGLFLSIAAVGLACVLLGRMLGDLGPAFPVAIGVLLLGVSLDMLGVLPRRASARKPSGRPRLRGIPGALGLGLAYGGLSGTCTFGFLAPILAIITIQARFGDGIMLVVFFALGHCLPIVLAGSFAGFAGRWLKREAWQRAGSWFRRGGGAFVGLLGLYFILRPLLGD